MGSGTRALVGDFGVGQALSDEQYGLFYLVCTGCQSPPPRWPARACWRAAGLYASVGRRADAARLRPTHRRALLTTLGLDASG